MTDAELARKLSAMHFPAKLMHIVDHEDDHIVRWAENGACFVIADQKGFEFQTLPRYFHHSKFASFQRQLNLYGFRRISRGPSQGFYFHPSFHQNRQDILSGVKRLPRKTSKHYAEMVQQRNDLLQKQRNISEQVRLTQSTEPLHKIEGGAESPENLASMSPTSGGANTALAVVAANGMLAYKHANLAPGGRRAKGEPEGFAEAQRNLGQPVFHNFYAGVPGSNAAAPMAQGGHFMFHGQVAKGSGQQQAYVAFPGASNGTGLIGTEVKRSNTRSRGKKAIRTSSRRRGGTARPAATSNGGDAGSGRSNGRAENGKDDDGDHGDRSAIQVPFTPGGGFGRSSPYLMPQGPPKGHGGAPTDAFFASQQLQALRNSTRATSGGSGNRRASLMPSEFMNELTTSSGKYGYPGGPLGSAPLAQGPLGSGPLTSGPLDGAPRNNQARSRGLLSNGPLSNGVLSSGPLSRGPLNTRPLGNGLQNARLLGSGPLNSGPLGSGPLGSAPLGAPLDSSSYGSGPVGVASLGGDPLKGPLGRGPLGNGSRDSRAADCSSDLPASDRAETGTSQPLRPRSRSSRGPTGMAPEAPTNRSPTQSRRPRKSSLFSLRRRSSGDENMDLAVNPGRAEQRGSALFIRDFVARRTGSMGSTHSASSGMSTLINIAELADLAENPEQWKDLHHSDAEEMLRRRSSVLSGRSDALATLQSETGSGDGDGEWGPQSSRTKRFSETAGDFNMSESFSDFQEAMAAETKFRRDCRRGERARS